MKLTKKNYVAISIGVLALFGIMFGVHAWQKAKVWPSFEVKVAASYEKTLTAISKMFNDWDSYKLLESDQKEFFLSVIDSTMSAEGGKVDQSSLGMAIDVVVQRYPDLPVDFYTQAKRDMSKAFEDVAATQESFISVKQEYEKSLVGPVNSWLAKRMGYPTQNYLDQNYDILILNQGAKDADQTRTIELQ